VPDTPAVIADIIGKAGCKVVEIEKKTGTQVHIEK
jgi:polyribonucleotide nucleotidyltransferase